MFFLLLTAALAAAGCEREHKNAPGTERAERVISLAPHLTELSFSAGAGDRLVGVVAHSDYPEEARALPQVGDAFRIDMEKMAALAPDLVLAWQGGNPDALIEDLRSRGYRVEALASRELDDVASNLLRIGDLAGSPPIAMRAARNYRTQLAALRTAREGRRRVSVFFQIGTRPLYTVGGAHNISRLLDLCGGDNVFAELTEIAPAVAEEAVLASDPEVIVTSASAEDLHVWHRWPEMRAVRDGNLAKVDADLVSRDSLRLLDGAVALCEILDAVRY